MPCGYTLPLDANTTHSAILRTQINSKATTRKRIWQQIVQAKIRAQARIIEQLSPQHTQHLTQLAKRVKSGDPDNKEAQAAQYYWPRLFDSNFRRNPELEGINSLLNYGYAIVRSSITRAICCAGLHPALGIHHSNQYNAFCLADDLMEPLRPLVDWQVIYILNNHQQAELFLSSEIKKQLLEIAAQQVIMKQRQLPLMVALHEYLASFKRNLSGEERRLQIPQIIGI